MREKLKKKSYGPAGGNKDPRSPAANNNLKPIDLLKDLEFRRSVLPAFKSTTREQWISSHASKTMPPDVGKYTPLYR